MRWFLTILACAGAASTARAATIVYVSLAPEQQIHAFRLNPATGTLTSIDNITVDAAPGSLCVDPKRQFLYASLRTSSSLGSFRIDRNTGKLTPINVVGLPPAANAAFVTTDRTGRWLLSVSYLAGTTVVHRLSDSGAIELPAIQTLTTAKTAHCIAINHDNNQVFVPHVTPNAVFQFRFHETTGQLTAAGTVAGGVEKAGPRHLAFHPGGRFAYTSNESASSVTAYGVDSSSGLTVLQTVSTLPADFQGQNSTAEIKVHPGGKFLWVSNRGHDSLAGFQIDPGTGRLTSIGQTATEKTPRSFDIEPAGKFAFGAGEGSGKLAVFRVDATSGQLDRIHTVEVGKSLTWVHTVTLNND